MSSLWRAKVLAALLALSAVINLILIFSAGREKKWDSNLHVVLAIYAGIGAAMFFAISQVEAKNPARGESLATIALFAYFLVPLIGFGLFMAFMK